MDKTEVRVVIGSNGNLCIYLLKGNGCRVSVNLNADGWIFAAIEENDVKVWASDEPFDAETMRSAAHALNIGKMKKE